MQCRAWLSFVRKGQVFSVANPFGVTSYKVLAAHRTSCLRSCGQGFPVRLCLGSQRLEASAVFGATFPCMLRLTRLHHGDWDWDAAYWVSEALGETGSLASPTHGRGSKACTKMATW